MEHLSPIRPGWTTRPEPKRTGGIAGLTCPGRTSPIPPAGFITPPRTRRSRASTIFSTFTTVAVGGNAQLLLNIPPERARPDATRTTSAAQGTRGQAAVERQPGCKSEFQHKKRTTLDGVDTSRERRSAGPLQVIRSRATSGKRRLSMSSCSKSRSIAVSASNPSLLTYSEGREWKEIARGGATGWKKLLRFPPPGGRGGLPRPGPLGPGAARGIRPVPRSRPTAPPLGAGPRAAGGMRPRLRPGGLPSERTDAAEERPTPPSILPQPGRGRTEGLTRRGPPSEHLEEVSRGTHRHGRPGVMGCGSAGVAGKSRLPGHLPGPRPVRAQGDPPGPSPAAHINPAITGSRHAQRAGRIARASCYIAAPSSSGAPSFSSRSPSAGPASRSRRAGSARTIAPSVAIRWRALSRPSSS